MELQHTDTLGPTGITGIPLKYPPTVVRSNLIFSPPFALLNWSCPGAEEVGPRLFLFFAFFFTQHVLFKINERGFSRLFPLSVRSRRPSTYMIMGW